MNAANRCVDGLAVITLAALLHLAAGHAAMTLQLTAGGYGPSSSSEGPRITWTPPAVNATGNFTLTSEVSSNSSMRYVSFAFSNGTKMEDALMVVDCYDIGGIVTMGTSNNVVGPNSTKDSVNDPASVSRVQLLSANKSSGVLTCSFRMKFTPTLDVNVMLASGAMAVGANASSPKKLYHGAHSHFVSANTIGQVLAASATSMLRAVSWWWSGGLLLVVLGPTRMQLL